MLQKIKFATEKSFLSVPLLDASVSTHKIRKYITSFTLLELVSARQIW